MMNLFSSFNPLNYSLVGFISVNLLIMFIPLLVNSKFFLFKKTSTMLVGNDFKILSKSILSVNMMKSMFLFISAVNLMNLFPFSFCIFSQQNITFFFSLVMWLAAMIYSFLNSWEKTLAHFTPSGSPMVLGPFMVVIEIISLLIRPITLSVRISANLIAGHLLIHLLSTLSLFCLEINLFYFFALIPISIVLNILETAVSIIQAYILCTLVNMYINENK